MDRRDVVLARQQRRVEIGRHRRREQRHIGAEIGVGLHLEAGDLVVGVERHLGMGNVVPAMRIGEEGLGAVAGPFHGTADLLRGPQRHHLFGIDEDLRAEAAADVGRDHAQLVLRGDVVERRQHEAGDVRVLRRRVEREMLLRRIVIGNGCARLHRVRRKAVVGDVELHHVGGLGERGVRGALVADHPVIDLVAGGFGMQLRRAGLDRCVDVGDRGQLFVVHDHGFGRVAREVFALGDHDCDGLADEAHRLRRHRRPCAHLHRAAVLGGDGPAADQVPDLVVDDLLSREHRDHARHLQGGGGIDPLHLGMRVRAADEMGVGHALQFDVVDVAALAGNETLVFLAHDARANAFNTHVWSSRPEFVFTALSLESGSGGSYFEARRLLGRLRDLHAPGPHPARL
ncbi:hypothetical protein ACVW0I_008437 [Bradyrhizobium sp. LM6.11]